MTQLTNITYCNETITLKSGIETSFLSLGERLMKIRDGELYAPQWSNFGEYVKELKISEGVASKLINVYRKFVLGFDMGLEPIIKAGGFHIVAECLPVIKTKEDAVEWLQKAETLSREDLRKEVKEAKTGIPMAACEHLDSYTIKVCRSCHDKIQQYEDTMPTM